MADLDLDKFLYRVNHDRLLAAVPGRVADNRMLKLIRAFLRAGVMEDELVIPVYEGTPPGECVDEAIARDRWFAYPAFGEHTDSRAKRIVKARRPSDTGLVPPFTASRACGCAGATPVREVRGRGGG